MLAVDAKTLRQWLKHSHLSLHQSPTDARVKCLTIEQVQHLAILHGRSLKLDSEPPSPPVTLVPPEKPTSLPSESRIPPAPSVSTLPSPLGEVSDLVKSLSSLEAAVASLQQQVAQLALSLVHERELRYEHRLSTLEALIQPPTEPSGHPQEALVSTVASMPDAEPTVERRLHPGELRARSRAISLIEYGAHGTYVIISPQEGELFFTPDSQEWFDWLACLSSFRFLGQLGRFTAYRDSRRRRPPSRCWSAVRWMHGRHHKCYLGTTDHLTISVLEQAAVTLQSHIPSL